MKTTAPATIHVIGPQEMETDEDGRPRVVQRCLRCDKLLHVKSDDDGGALFKLGERVGYVVRENETRFKETIYLIEDDELRPGESPCQ